MSRSLFDNRGEMYSEVARVKPFSRFSEENDGDQRKEEREKSRETVFYPECGRRRRRLASFVVGMKTPRLFWLPTSSLSARHLPDGDIIRAFSLRNQVRRQINFVFLSCFDQRHCT